MDVSDKEGFVHDESDQSADISALWNSPVNGQLQGKVIIEPSNGLFEDKFDLDSSKADVNGKDTMGNERHKRKRHTRQICGIS